jgi:hypothetical protein
MVRTGGGHDGSIVKVEPIPLRIPFAAPFKISHGEARDMVEVVIVRVP